MSSHKKILYSTFRIEKRDDFSKMCTIEIGKFSLHYLTHHGRIANWRISISLVISNFKNSYFSYSLPDFFETFTDMFSLVFLHSLKPNFSEGLIYLGLFTEASNFDLYLFIYLFLIYLIT